MQHTTSAHKATASTAPQQQREKKPCHPKEAGHEGAHNTRQGGTAIHWGKHSQPHSSGSLLLSQSHHSTTQVGGGRVNDRAPLRVRPIRVRHTQPNNIRPLHLTNDGAAREELDIGAALFRNLADTCVLAHQTLVHPKISRKLANSTPRSIKPITQENFVHGANIAICHSFVNGKSTYTNNGTAPCNQPMKVISEIRRERLGQLRDELGITWREMNRRMGRLETDATLNQIWNRAAESSTGKTRLMGDQQARLLETTFSKPTGWMDNDPAFDKLQHTAAEPPATYTAWPAAGMSLEQLHAALTPEQRGEVSGMIRAFLSMNAREQAQQTSQAHLPAPQSTLLTGT